MAGQAPSEVISVTGLVKYFKEDPNCVSKGELKYKSDFILEVKLIDMTVVASVRASMKDKCYKVKLTVDREGDIVDSCCECPRGKWLCSHMAATAIYVNKKGWSKTDLPNAWIAKPRTASKDKSVRLKNHFRREDNNKGSYTAASRDVNNDDLEFLVSNLSSCSLKWMLNPEPITRKDPLEPISIEELMEVFVESKESFMENCKVTQAQI